VEILKLLGFLLTLKVSLFSSSYKMLPLGKKDKLSVDVAFLSKKFITTITFSSP